MLTNAGSLDMPVDRCCACSVLTQSIHCNVLTCCLRQVRVLTRTHGTGAPLRRAVAGARRDAARARPAGGAAPPHSGQEIARRNSGTLVLFLPAALGSVRLVRFRSVHFPGGLGILEA